MPESTLPAEMSPQEIALIQGDLSRLDNNQRMNYYMKVCESVGLNPLTKPFEYITLNGKMVLYARKDATDQLRKVHNVSIEITSRDKVGEAFIVTARATLASGRKDESIGAVNIAGQKGDSLVNAMMKAETKAKRRVTLSVCGLGMLDESEMETIPSQAFHEKPREEAAKKLEPVRVPTYDDYVIQFGKYRGRLFKSIDPVELADYALYIRGKAHEEGVEIKNPETLFFLNMVEDLAINVP